MTPDNTQSQPNAHRPLNGVRYSYGRAIPAKRSWTPTIQDNSSAADETLMDKEPCAVDTRRQRYMNDLFSQSARRLHNLFDNSRGQTEPQVSGDAAPVDTHRNEAAAAPRSQSQQKKAARNLDEEDYGDEDEEDEAPMANLALLRPDQDTIGALANPSSSQHLPPGRSSMDRISTVSSQNQNKSPEEIRKALEEEKKIAERTAKDSFLNTFYTLENDRDAMVEQQKLDDLDRQVENEISGPDGSNNAAKHGAGAQPGSLSSANLGASSLALKHLIARIDAKRDMVHASDAKLRSLMSEVRKNRSKWANEERVGQEELYEAAERVLMDLKGMSEYAAPFLQRVNRRDAPDYYRVINRPMDIGTMIKKLKGFDYKSKKEFVLDLDLIWANCLKYNADPNHFLRKKAEHMKKETARLIPLIPDITVRDRAEVEAEEREDRKRQYAELDSDDEDQPIVATRGRKAPSKKGMKGTSSARKAPPTVSSDSPAPETRPPVASAPGMRNEQLRSEAENFADGSQHGFSTPPPGNATPLGGGAAIDGGVAGLHADVSTIDGASGVNIDPTEEHDEDDEAYKTWKQVTKKDRAQVASERHRLFQSDRLNVEEPALLRTKAGMRRWMRQQNTLNGDESLDDTGPESQVQEGIDAAPAATTLAENIEDVDESLLPDYYYPLAAVPQINHRIQWVEDTEGQVIDRREECLRVVPSGHFTSGESLLNSRIESNMRQMQDTRKIMAKIGMVKQMQLQSQTYQNQFQKYEPEPFREVDIPPTVVSDNGPVISPWASRAALQRSVAKIFYHAGFEDYQPSTLDAITDIAADHFKHLVTTLNIYREAPMIQAIALDTSFDETNMTAQPAAHLERTKSDVRQVRPRFTREEAILHTLQVNGHELETLTAYVEEEVPRISSKLTAHHESVRQHYADLVRPALDPTMLAHDGGAGAFNDGSEAQFVAGDFAEDIDEDFFGFKELGLDREFGISALSVPLHLLQSRMHQAYQPTNAASASSATTETIMEKPPQWDPITAENLHNEIGIVQSFFAEKLEKTEGGPLIEDEELPQKQQFPKPRLPPTGKISSPRKRPPREQAMLLRKKRRLEIETEREREREASGANARGTSTLSASAPTASATDRNANHVLDDQPSSSTMVNGDTDESHQQTRSLVNGKITNGTGTLVNGIPNHDNGDGDGDDDSNKLDEGVNQLPAKPISKLRLETPKETANDTNTDPQKGDRGATVNKDTELSAEAIGPNPSSKEDREGETGMLSPESLPIAAH